MDRIPPMATALSPDGSLQPLNSANLWTTTSVKILVDLLLYSEIEVTVSNKINDKIEINCPMINDVLVTKGLAIFENREYPYSDFLVGHKFKAYVSSASQCGTLLIQDVGSSLLLDQMTDMLATHFDDLQNRITVNTNDIAPGSLVAAMYSSDKNFYRAQVMDVDGERCTVYFIDYGNKEEQDIRSLYELPTRFCQLPYQAIECKFYNVVISTEKFSKDLQQLLLDKTIGESIDCEIMEHIRIGKAKFSITAKSNQENLSTCLIAKSYAKLRRDTEPLQYSYVELVIGSQQEVCIAHVEPNGTFFVSLMKDAAKLDK